MIKAISLVVADMEGPGKVRVESDRGNAEGKYWLSFLYLQQLAYQSVNRQLDTTAMYSVGLKMHSVCSCTF